MWSTTTSNVVKNSGRLIDDRSLIKFIEIVLKPLGIHTDNALNFFGAVNELKKIQNFFSEQANINKIQEYCNNEGIIWKFLQALVVYGKQLY